MPIAFGLAPISRVPLMGGDSGVAQTIDQMRSLVNEALTDPSFLRQAKDIVKNVPAFDDVSEAQALYDWVRANIRFTKDPVDKETLYPPTELLQIRSGDCDDISMLLGALLMAIGYPARLMTVAANGDEFSHVYVEGQVNGQWIPMDPARSDSQFGVAPPSYTRARWWSLADSSQGDMPGTLGHYRRFKSHVSGYGRMGRHRTMAFIGAPSDGAMAAPASGQITSSTIATVDQGIADIIRAASGQPASPYSYASGPYASFQTVNSPGLITAGYPAAATPGFAVTGSSNWLLIAAFAIGAMLLMRGK
jgi:Transglutaminase-like superfamily